MIRLKRLYEDLNQEVPEYLYHATYAELLPNIKKIGLNTTDTESFWSDSVKGIVYLANDPDVAEAYAEEGGDLDNDLYSDNIVIFKIDTRNLDLDKLHDDRNIIVSYDQVSGSFEYRGSIPWEHLKIHKET